MLTFGTPAFLLAGALAALAPLALHLIRRRPPARAPLPTERFLTADPRTSVRVSRPTDLLLLALRMLLLFLAGAAFARPAWLPAARGTGEIVLLDRGAAFASGDGWRQAVSIARNRLLGADGRPRGALVLFDTAVVQVPRRRITPALFDSLAAAPPSTSPVRYAAALRAVPAAARELRGADSVRVTLVTRPRWSGWSDGIAPLRRAAWPGAIDLAALQDAIVADSAGRVSAPESMEAIVTDPGDRGMDYLVAALGAVGWKTSVLARGQPLPAGAALVVVPAPLPADGAGAVAAAARAGATVLADGAAGASLAGERLWTGGAMEGTAGAIWFADGLHLAGFAARVGGGPAPGARVLAAWDDGRPAAVARRVGRGCIVYLATEVGQGEMVLDAAYPRVLDRLARGCESPETTDDDVPLDAGARAVLRGSGPRTLAAGAAAGRGGGTALGRWMMAAALLAALAETFLAYGRKRAV